MLAMNPVCSEVPHPGVPPDTPLWRYLTLPKFLSFLHIRSLVFARADTLGDHFEGTFPLTSRTARDSALDNLVAQADSLPRDVPRDVVRKELEKMIQSMAGRLREIVYVSSWCMGPSERVDMWERYGSQPCSVVIQTTAHRLATSFSGPLSMPGIGDAPVQIWPVQYLDYDDDASGDPIGVLSGDGDPTLLSYRLFAMKRREFAAERELRCVACFDQGASINVRSGGGRFETPLSLRMPIDLDTLVCSARICPDTPDWARESVQAAVDAFHVRFQLRPSALDSSPRL